MGLTKQIISAKVLEERDLPVFIVAFKTHEINCYINPSKRSTLAKPLSGAGEGASQQQAGTEEGYAVEVGSREEIQAVQYVVVLTKDAHLNSSSSTPEEDEDEDEDVTSQQKKKTAAQKGPLNPQDPAQDVKGDDTITGGWKIIDLARRSSVAFL